MPDPPADAELALKCAACGYDLRGLPDDGRCPECGAAVAESRQAVSLFRADPRWLRRLELGAWLCPLSLLGLLAALAAAWLLLDVGSPPQIWRAWAQTTLLSLVVAGVASGPWLLLARPRPAAFDARPRRRRIGRVALLVCVAGWAAGRALNTLFVQSLLAGGPGWSTPGNFAILMNAMQLAGFASAAAQAAAAWIVARHLAALLRLLPPSTLPRLVIAAGWLLAAGGASIALMTGWWIASSWFDVPFLSFTSLVPVLAYAAVALSYGGAAFAAVLAVFVALRLRGVRGRA